MTARPNVLLFVADQLRWDWLSCTGTEGPETPVLDALAARGVRFETCVTNSAMCVPARIALAAGLLPHRLGALGNDAYLPARVPTWYQRLRDHDYRVGVVGKLDLAKPDRYNGLRGDRPSVFRWGFTHPVEAEGKMHAGTSPTPIGPYTSWLAERGLLAAFHEDYMARLAELYTTRRAPGMFRDSVLPEDAFEDAWIGERAAAWVADAPDDFPWFLQVGFVGPHDPYDPPATAAAAFRERAMAAPIPDTNDRPARVAALRFDYSDHDAVVCRRQYSASTAIIDRQVGLVLEALEASGALDRTVVMFTSDHGDMLGDFGLFQKHVAYEGAARVPLVVAGPGVAEGAVSTALVELMDVGPTVLEVAGIPSLPDVDARSFASVLDDPMQDHRSEVVCMEEQYVAVRTDTHKLIRTLGAGDELFDLVDDPHETRNVVDDHPKEAQVLRSRLKERLAEGRWLR